VSDILKAVEILRRGGLVAFPTETVYGLGADATNAEAIQKVFAAKGRPSHNPLIVHIADISIAKRFAAEWPDVAQLLAEKFWPGPLTIVLPKSPHIVDAVTAGRQTVGLRVPNHPQALDLLKRFTGPLAAPSANRSTRVSPTTAQHVRDELGDSVDLILDGGPCTVGIESTVLDLTTTPPTILRPGAVTQAQIEELIGPVHRFNGNVDANIPASSPGQQALHYSPRAIAYSFEPSELSRIKKISLQHGKSAILTIAPERGDLQMPDDPEDYAKRLYATLRELDAHNVQAIFIQLPPDEPQWLAVRDRLLRATRPLPDLLP
jgi:L-threonylcarbamoyladenylate synthase